jgi:transposase
MGASGRRMIEAMIAGVRDPRKLAALAGRGVKATPKELYDALHGRLTDHHRFLLRGRLGQWDALGASIKVVDDEVDARAARMDMGGERADKARFSDLIRQLESIPGVSKLSALTILSEIGADMSRFATAGHLVAWSGLCPGQNESAGKRKRTRLGKGAPWLKTMLVQCAWAAKRANNSYYKAQFFRLQARRGPQKAILAPWPLRSSPPSTTCSRTGPSTRTSAPATSTADPPRPRSSAWPARSRSSAMKSPCNRSRKPLSQSKEPDNSKAYAFVSF